MDASEHDAESAAGQQRFEDVLQEEQRMRAMLDGPAADHDAVIIKEIHKVHLFVRRLVRGTDPCDGDDITYGIRQSWQEIRPEYGRSVYRMSVVFSTDTLKAPRQISSDRISIAVRTLAAR